MHGVHVSVSEKSYWKIGSPCKAMAPCKLQTPFLVSYRTNELKYGTPCPEEQMAKKDLVFGDGCKVAIKVTETRYHYCSQIRRQSQISR